MPYQVDRLQHQGVYGDQESPIGSRELTGASVGTTVPTLILATAQPAYAPKRGIERTIPTQIMRLPGASFRTISRSLNESRFLYDWYVQGCASWVG